MTWSNRTNNLKYVRNQRIFKLNTEIFKNVKPYPGFKSHKKRTIDIEKSAILPDKRP